MSKRLSGNRLSDLKRGLKGILIGVSLIALFTIYIKKKSERADLNFDLLGKFTLGQVVQYDPRTLDGASSISSAFLKFSFKVQGIKYVEASDYYVPAKNGPKKGSFFMAVYLPNDPTECGLLLDYPVKDSVEYRQYMKEFKINRPNLSELDKRLH